MARPSKADLLQRVFTRSLAEFRRTESASRDERVQAKEDRRFVSIPGAMWEGDWLTQFQNRPRIEMNTIMASLVRITNEYRNNPITVDFQPKDGSDADELADTCDALYRADFADSVGDEAVDNAFDEALAGGFGAYRLCCEVEDEYEDESPLRIRFKPIFDADTSVYFDLDAKRQDKSDAKRCWVLYSMTRESFKEVKWPIGGNQDPATWPKSTENTVGFDWCTPDVIYIAEYYEVEDERTPMVRLQYPDETTVDFEADDIAEAEAGEEGSEYDEIRTALALNATVVKEWTQRSRRVHKYIMSGGGILEDCGYIAGKHIPVIPVYGKRWFIDNVERMMGHVRLAKDPARLMNMQVSVFAEIAALSGYEKPIVTPQQIAGHEAMWANDNVKRFPYLLLNPITDAAGNVVPGGPVGATAPPNIPPATAAVMQIADKFSKEILGSDRTGDEMVSNLSAKAVELIQTRVDMQAFIYMSNMAKSRRRDGEVWLSMAQDAYVEDGRRMKGITIEGDATSIELRKPKLDDKGRRYFANDLSRAKMDVAVDVGPSFTSRRDALVRSLLDVAQVTPDPAKQSMLLSLAVMNMQGEGLQDLRQYMRKELVAQGVVQPNEEERAAMAAAAQQPQQPDPQAMYLMAEARKSDAQAVQAVAATAKAEADTEKARADAVATIAGIETDRMKVAIDAAEKIGRAFAPGAQPAGA